MPRRIWNDGMEVVESDLSAGSASLEIELYDRLIYELMNRQQNLSFGDSFLCSNVSALVSQVKLGNGVYYDSTQVDPEPKTRLLRVGSNTNVNHTAADPTNPRYDLICITPARATIQTASRNFKNASTGAISTVTMDIETDWSSSLSVVAGTPAGSPAVPSTPSGKLALAKVLVAASSGIAGAGSYTDLRVRNRKPSGWIGIKTIAANTTMDLDDETILINGAYTYTLLPAASCYDSTTGVGKVLTVTKIDAGSASAVAGDGSELISEANSQPLTNQYTSIRLYSNGVKWYLI